MERVVFAGGAALSQSWQRALSGWIERMLRIYFLQQWFNLSDPAVEEALYDSPLMRCFAGIDLGNEPVPDETRSVSSATCSKNTISARPCSRR